jgi:SAM-dependent methyltransferase
VAIVQNWRRLKGAVPWWGKIGLKLVMARLPLPYRLFARFGVFRHGSMDRPEYVLEVFRTHARHNPAGNWTGLEFGPGDSVFSAVLAKRYGCRRFWLVDAGDFAAKSPALYRNMAASLERQGLADGLSALCGDGEPATLFRNCDAAYLTRGVASLAEIESDSVDFIWSHAVLEHVGAAEFEACCREMRRILRPGGRASHVVDFRDHLQAGLHNLRFPSTLWERDWFARRSGFYTNRIRPTAMADRFARAGFAVRVLYDHRWPEPPISEDRLAPEFRGLNREDLVVWGCHFLLEKT